MIEFIQMVLDAIGVDASSSPTFVNTTDAITTRCSSSSSHHNVQVDANDSCCWGTGSYSVLHIILLTDQLNLCSIP
eukprot:scaffold142_cov164-Skeletonema_menzelii.AAC.2